MNIKESIKHLKQTGHVRFVEKSGYSKKPWRVFFNHKYESLYSDIGLIQLARCYTSDSVFNTKMNKEIQKISNSRNRAKTRSIIDREDFEEFPQEGSVYKENRWYHD